MATEPRHKPKPEAILALDPVEMRDRLAKGALRVRDLAEACIARIKAVEPEVLAWAWLEESYILAEADRLDVMRQAGRPIGPLHGMPIGIKDIIDTKKIQTENGTPIDKGRVPTEDAVIVSRLKAAGALIMGKTVTTELAYLHPGKTRNPYNAAHTPGGSSQGSAAAVAAGMVPLAIGTQTGGSVIRPASYCGTVAFKPSFGLIPRTGVLPQSPSLDTIGVFAMSTAGAAMVADVLAGYDAGDTATEPCAPPRLFSTCQSKPPVRPTFAVLSAMPSAVELHPDMASAMAELTEVLGDYAFEITLPPLFDEAATIRERINFAEMSKCYYGLERRGGDHFSPEIRAAMEKGKDTLARDYISALDWPGVLRSALAEVFERCDAIICPATPGPAPEGLDSTGPAICNGLWTLCGVPVVNLPLFEASNGLPMGLQVVGRMGDDGRLLRSANSLWKTLTEETES